ncbi:endoglucanase H [Abditibacteriota bacterium]|nr:endoglucanase H [Abditibacteriota bacterium]
MSLHRCLIVASCILTSLILQCGVRAENISSAFISLASLGKGVPTQKCDPTQMRPIALGAYYFSNGRCAPGDADAVSAFKAQTGRNPAVWMIYQSWMGWNEFPSAQAKRARALGSTLMVTWEPWAGNNDSRNWNCQDVVAGRYDGLIRSYARAVKFAGVPVMIRFAHEMNGDWYPWGTAYNGYCQRTNNNSPAMFVGMWKHVVSVFRKEGALNAKWVWSPNILYTNDYNDQTQQERDLFSLYPGDAWVDWVGVSVYNDGARRPWRSFSSLFDPTYRALTQLCAKPMMIAELGVTEQGAPQGQTKAAWLEQALLSDIPQRYNRVRLVTYFCRDKSSTGESNYRFDSSPAALAAFRQVANSPLYGWNLN